MRKYRKSIWTNNLAVIVITSVFCIFGIIISAVLCSLLVYYILSDISYTAFFSSFSLILGTYPCVYFCGKHKRKHGLMLGISAATLIYIILCLLSLTLTGIPAPLKKYLLLIISCSAGGIAGTNSKIKMRKIPD